MSAPALLFVHGGGDDAYAWDKKIADRLQAALGSDAEVEAPLFKSLEEVDWSDAMVEVGDALRALPAGAIVVAHSVGGCAVLDVLQGGLDPRLRHLFLLAPPYDDDFAARLPEDLPITLWHSRDDETIPVCDAERYAEKLPAAEVHLLDGYGHQFTRSLTFLAEAIRGAMT